MPMEIRFMRAKMVVETVERGGYREGDKFKYVDKIRCKAVGSDKFGADGSSEDNTFATFTPQGELTLTITNQDLTARIEPGQKFYLDFTHAD